MACKSWFTKKQEETIDNRDYIPEQTFDTSDHCKEQSIDLMNHSHEQIDEQPFDTVKHDHQYAQNEEKASLFDDCLDVHEEEVDQTTMLQRSVIPVDS